MGTYPDRPVLAVLAVVVRGEEVLLVQRANPPDAGKWGFPGGRVELGETLEQAALRELAEETGVAATAGGVLTALDVIDRDTEGRVRFHFTLVAVLCRWLAGQGVAADDALAVAWTRPAEIGRRFAAVSADVARVAEMALMPGAG